MTTTTFFGRSGQAYHFNVVVPGRAMPTSPGLYVLIKDRHQNALGLFGHTTGPALGLGLLGTPNRYEGLYVGKAAGGLSERVGAGLRQHHKLPDAIWAGMTHIGVLVRHTSDAELSRWELDLIHGNPDWLNGLSPLVAALMPSVER